jgi:hypothetical protein
MCKSQHMTPLLGFRWWGTCNPSARCVSTLASDVRWGRHRDGGEGRNRTRPAFHKPLEINYLNHHRYLDNKGVCDLSQANSSLLFLTPFYSPPTRFAGTAAGTFQFVFAMPTFTVTSVLMELAMNHTILQMCFVKVITQAWREDPCQSRPK